jgi:molybdopterin-containing oxidoreductase family membrane subunit
VIVVTSLAQDFLPSSWAYFKPTWVDIGMMAGSFGLFMTLFLLFCRFLPILAIAEVKTTMPESDPHYGDESHRGIGYGETTRSKDEETLEHSR